MKNEEPEDNQLFFWLDGEVEEVTKEEFFEKQTAATNDIAGWQDLSPSRLDRHPEQYFFYFYGVDDEG